MEIPLFSLGEEEKRENKQFGLDWNGAGSFVFGGSLNEVFVNEIN